MKVAAIGLVQRAQSYFEELTCIWAEVTQVLGQTSVITKRRRQPRLCRPKEINQGATHQRARKGLRAVLGEGPHSARPWGLGAGAFPDGRNS